MHNIVHKNITHKGYNPSLIIIMRTSRGSLSLIQVQRHNTHLLPFHPPTPSPGLPPPPNAATNIPTGPTVVAPIKYSDLIFTSEPISSVAGDHVPFSEISFKVGELSRVGQKRHSFSKNNCGGKSLSRCLSMPNIASVSESILGGVTQSSYQNLTIEAERRTSLEQPTYVNVDIVTEVIPPDTQQPADCTNITICAKLKPDYVNMRPLIPVAVCRHKRHRSTSALRVIAQ